MRRLGLQGLFAFISTVEDLDNFVANFMDANQKERNSHHDSHNKDKHSNDAHKEKNLMPIILDNMYNYRKSK